MPDMKWMSAGLGGWSCGREPLAGTPPSSGGSLCVLKADANRASVNTAVALTSVFVMVVIIRTWRRQKTPRPGGPLGEIGQLVCVDDFTGLGACWKASTASGQACWWGVLGAGGACAR